MSAIAPPNMPDGCLRPVRFLHRAREVQVSGLAPTTTVLAWLREHAGCAGTKEGCNEGDCGACMVAVAQLEADGELVVRNVNACLLYLPALDGKALFTVEDLQGLGGGQLHPVQRALVEHHGSQCGFCTPGFVMTMWAVREEALARARVPDRQEWADALAGNLCRCTGYRPILDAAQACLQDPGHVQGQPACEGDVRGQHHCPARLDRDALRAQLQALASPSPLHYGAHDPAYGERRHFSAPRSSDELAACLQAHPKALILGGATDIGLWTNKAHRDVGHLVATGAATDLQQIHESEGWLRIGAAATLEAAWATLARHWPTLGDLWRRFASPPVRHAGTLAGNVANGSPIGDAPPILMALRARLVLRCGPQRRTVPLDDFYLGYQRKDLLPGEFIEWIEVPLPEPGGLMRAWKISKRYDSDISAVCAGFGLRFTPTGAARSLTSAVLAFGGLAATVQRARHAEQALLRHGWSLQGIRAAQNALAQDYTPMTDLRASAQYRVEAAAALLERLWLTVGSTPQPGQEPVPTPSLEVWR